MSNFSFEYIKPDANSRARLGSLTTPHGIVQTPAFIFCATKAAIKGASIDQMRAAGTQFMLANTYHLMLRPGAELVAAAGGLHRFMGWNGPLLTDSGGFQIFSLGHGSVASEIKGKRMHNRPQTLLKVDEVGATFRSYIDGKTYLLTPEKSIEVQRLLGPDLVLVLDECTPFHVDKDYTARSMRMSHNWASRSLAEFDRHDNGAQKLYGIVQGGIYDDLRAESCDFINHQDFFGHAIGGSLGADKSQMQDVVAATSAKLDPKRPIHLLGIGGIVDIFNGVEAGIDTFDCVHPTRLARHGGALVRPPHRDSGKEHINLRNHPYRDDFGPIEADCDCYTCRNHSRAYIHHLIKSDELLAHTLITIHNVHFMNRMLTAIRNAIASGTLNQERSNWCTS